MFDVAPTELLLVAVVALVVIGPKDLPRAMRFVGQWVAKARGVARHFRVGIDEMIRQSELEEMEKKWAAENERIMREHPAQAVIETTATEAAPVIKHIAAIEHSPAAEAAPAAPAPAAHEEMVSINNAAQASLPLDVPPTVKPARAPRAKKPASNA